MGGFGLFIHCCSDEIKIKQAMPDIKFQSSGIPGREGR